ncbi:type III-A CRISPR-associated protein Csm2 [Clostridium sp.]|uniref:type III-A CRISPR-associated protein Csm2 n=1 Tax=Clostridium sp. TaxID=1506 RepID=UPI002FDECFA7
MQINNVKYGFTERFKILIDNNCKVYYFDKIINRKPTLNNLNDILKNYDGNKQLEEFINYLKQNIRGNKQELEYIFRFNSIKVLFDHEESKEIEYFRKNIVTIDDNYDQFINNVKGYSYILKNNGMTTSQIRNVYSDILRANSVKDLKKLRPKFAYIAGRNPKNSVKKFMDLLDYVVRSMDSENEKEQVKNFKNFLEAIVAYMKYFGDKY